MNAILNSAGEVKIQYVKRQFSKTKFENTMSTGYVLLHDLGKNVVLGFRRPFFEGEYLLPKEISLVINEDEMKRCIDYFEPDYFR